ncbi:MAG: VWA domain-containing protein [Pseudomonadota bacterium]
MTDDLDDLRKALKAATPAPDADAKAHNIALARKNFAGLQGSQPALRPKSNRIWTGVKTMLSTMTTRGGLVASTALIAIGFVALNPQLLEFGAQPEAVTLPASVGPEPLEMLAEDRPATEILRQEAPAVSAAEPVMIDDVMAGASNLYAPPARPETGFLSRSSQSESYDWPETRIYPQPAPRPSIVLPDGDAGAPAPAIENDTETFPDTETNPLKITAEEPVSTFSIDVDTASYAVVRNSLMNGVLPPRGAVRVEEMVNYFPYTYPAPEGDVPFQPTVTVAETPWNSSTQLVHIGLQGAEVTERPPLNLVFLIDTSGSMQAANKLPLLKQSFRLMLSQLRPEDEVSIVTYAGSAGQVLKPTPAAERTTILAALDQLQAGGSTAGQAGLQQAYDVAEGMSAAGEVSRVILATDGDFNVGLSDPGALTDFIANKRESGTYLSVLGFGRGNLDDATMQALAQNGNGQAAYIDTLSEAQKVLVDQLTGALFPIANDVKVQVEFNPARIAEYRLIGYETRALRREDFNNDRVDAGEIGAGHTVTAIYEVTPVGSDAVLSDPLRYGGSVQGDPGAEIGFLKLRYKAPGEGVSQLIETPLPDVSTLGQEAQFATAVAGFAQLLRGESQMLEWDYSDAIALATGAKGEDPFGYRAEAISLMRLANSLSQ